MPLSKKKELKNQKRLLNSLKMRFIILVSLLSIIIGLVACYKKYPEDEFISFRSPKNRLADRLEFKYRAFKKCYVDGNDYTNDYISYPTYFYKVGFRTSAPSGGEENMKSIGINSRNISVSCGHWSIVKKGEYNVGENKTYDNDKLFSTARYYYLLTQLIIVIFKDSILMN